MRQGSGSFRLKKRHNLSGKKEPLASRSSSSRTTAGLVGLIHDQRNFRFATTPEDVPAVDENSYGKK